MGRFGRTVALLSLAAAMAGTAALAQGDPIETRRNIMKGVGAATRTGTQMARGDVAFDLARAQDVLKTYAAAAETFHTHFPESSKTGGGTTASPKIWDSQADFRARFDAWGRDISRAAAATKDLATFRENFSTVTRACQGCHQAYRVGT